jgi:hypothetical protein
MSFSFCSLALFPTSCSLVLAGPRTSPCSPGLSNLHFSESPSHSVQAFINTAREIYRKIQDGVFDVSNEVSPALHSCGRAPCTRIVLSVLDSRQNWPLLTCVQLPTCVSACPHSRTASRLDTALVQPTRRALQRLARRPRRPAPAARGSPLSSAPLLPGLA